MKPCALHCSVFCALLPIYKKISRKYVEYLLGDYPHKNEWKYPYGPVFLRFESLGQKFKCFLDRYYNFMLLRPEHELTLPTHVPVKIS